MNAKSSLSRLFIVGLIVALFGLCGASSAFAGTSGGGGTVGTGCGSVPCPNFSFTTYGDGSTDVYTGSASTKDEQGSGDTRAWDIFITAATGTNFTGHTINSTEVNNALDRNGAGANNCQKSAYIWAMMETDVRGDNGSGTTWDEIPVSAGGSGVAFSASQEYPSSGNDTSTLPIVGNINSSQTGFGNNTWSNSDQGAAVQHAEQGYNKGNPWIVLCSYYPGSSPGSPGGTPIPPFPIPVPVPQPPQGGPPIGCIGFCGVPTGPTPTKLICPQHQPTGVDYYIIPGRGDAVIPAGDTTDAEAGAFCYAKAPDVKDYSTTHYRTLYQTVPAPNLPPVNYYGPTSWTTTMSADPSATPNTYGTNQGTHPGDLPFGTNGAVVGNSIYSAFAGVINNPAYGCSDPGTLDRAIQQSNSQPESSVSLTSPEQEAEAQGGIFAVSQNTVDTTFTTNTTQAQTQLDKISQTDVEEDTTIYSFSLPASERRTLGLAEEEYNSTGKELSQGPINYGVGYVNDGAPYSTGCYPSPPVSTSNYSKNFQIITSHADPTGFNQALTRGGISGNGSNVIPQTDTNYSDADYTNTYTDPNNLPLGFNRGDRAGLFNKLAAYSGSSLVGSGGQDNYTFSRDGNYHGIKLPFWGLSAPSTSPIQAGTGSVQATVVNLWDKSSPLPQETQTNGGTQSCDYQNTGYEDCGFLNVDENTGANGVALGTNTSQSAPGTSLFNGANPITSPLTAATQFNDPFSYNGEYSSGITTAPSFMASSIWASNGQEPVILSGYQIWNPNLAIREPTSNIGWGNPGGGETESTGTVTTPINGVVEATHSSTDDANTAIGTNGQNEISIVAANTGTNEFDNSPTPTDSMDCVGASPNVTGCDFTPSTNILDANGPGTGYPGVTPPATSQNPLWTSINFVRGTGE
jgi:hypothetical protein